MYTLCSELGILMYSTGNSMNNSLSYCGLIDARISSSENICLYFGLVNARIRASDKDSIQLFCICIQTDLDISKELFPMAKTGVIR